MTRITAAQRRATAYVTTTSTHEPATADYGTCEDCGKPLEAHEFNRCGACVIARGAGVLAANSVTFFERDTAPDIITTARKRAARKAASDRDLYATHAAEMLGAPDTHSITCDGVMFCEDCPHAGSCECAEYQAYLDARGRYDTAQAAEIAGAFSPRFG